MKRFIIIMIFIVLTLPCLSQTRLVEFVKPDSLYGYYEYSFNEDEFVGLMKIRNSIDSDCDFRYVTYNSETGDIVNIQDFYYLISEKYCLYPQKLVIEEDEKYLYSTPSNIVENNQLVLTVTDKDTSILYQQKWDKARDRIYDMEIQHLNDDGVGYIAENISEQNKSRTIRFFDFKITGDSLTKELLNTSTTKQQISINVFRAMNDDYITSFALYEDLLEFSGNIVDSVCGLDIYRFDKNDNSIDSTFIPFDLNYRFVEGDMNNNKFVFPLVAQDSSIKNEYYLSNKIKIFSYSFDDNSLNKVKDVVFKKNVGINGFNYDEITDRYCVYGYSTDAPQYSASYTDYWLAILDNEFNVILDYTWKEEPVERLEEYVYSFEPIEENKFYITYGTNDITGQIAGKAFSGIISLDMLTNVEQDYIVSSFSLSPNPADSRISINFDAEVGSSYDLSLFDLLGNKVGRIDNGIIDTEQYNIDYDISQLPAGVYFVRLDLGGEVITKKFMKE